MKKPHVKRKLLEIAVLLVLDVVFFGLIDPTAAWAIVVVMGYALLMINLYVIIGLLLALAEDIFPFSLATKKRLTIVTTVVLGLLIAMQSIGQLTLKDVLAVIPLIVVLTLYVSYMFRDASN